MCVRTEVVREVTLDVAALCDNELEEARNELWLQPIRIGKQVKRPGPRYYAKGQLEAARPVDAELRWVGIHPRRGLSDKRFGKTLITGQPISLSQRYEMRVTVQFPGYFLVAGHLRIEVIDLTPVNPGCSLCGCRFETPIDRIAESQVAIAEQIKAAVD